MVSSLIEHEQIQTTVAKAKEAARLAEKLITLGKKGSESNRSTAQAFLTSTRLMPKLFETLAVRYRQRPGGYTRIYKYGHRPGDNAPKAVLELVDGPRDTKFEMTARKVGWEVMGWKERGEHTGLYQGMERGVETIDVLGGNAGFLRDETRKTVQKILRYRPAPDRQIFGKKAAEYLNTLLVEDAVKDMSEEKRRQDHREQSKTGKVRAEVRHQNRQIWERVWNREPGQVTAGSLKGSLQTSKAALARVRPWQLPKGKRQTWEPLAISARKRYVVPKTIRVKTVEIQTDRKGKRASRVVIEEGRSLKDMPFRQRALPPKVQSVLSI